VSGWDYLNNDISDRTSVQAKITYGLEPNIDFGQFAPGVAGGDDEAVFFNVDFLLESGASSRSYE
jgi:hypothetical protein